MTLYFPPTVIVFFRIICSPSFPCVIFHIKFSIAFQTYKHPEQLEYAPGMFSYLRFPQAEKPQLSMKRKIIMDLFYQCFYSRDFPGASMVCIQCNSYSLFSLFILRETIYFISYVVFFLLLTTPPPCFFYT